jgi:uncharacterized protein YbbC (DUF1343 family)
MDVLFLLQCGFNMAMQHFYMRTITSITKTPVSGFALRLAMMTAVCLGTLFVGTLHAQRSFRYDVKNGIDVLVAQDFKTLQGQRVALVTNQSGRLRTLVSTLSAFQSSKNLKLTTLLTPEHGYYGLARAGDAVADSNDAIKGVAQFSLYGKTRRPTKEMFDNCDVVVYDIQDVGNRSYTYLSTMFNVMDACAEYDKPLYVLDRPNPLGGKVMDGAVLDTAFTSFVGIIPIPLVHGCTLGELAQMINGEGWLPAASDGKPRKCSLTIVKADGWQRWMTWEDTDFQWIPTSPHVPSVDAARGLSVLGFIGELNILNIGVGYTLPFQYIGAPTLNTEVFLEALRRVNLPNIILVPTRYRPFYSKFSGADCNGVILTFFPDATRFKPFTAGLDIFLALRIIQPELFAVKSVTENARSMFIKVTGSDKLFEMLFVKRAPDEEIRRFASKGIKEFAEMRKKYLLYD